MRTPCTECSFFKDEWVDSVENDMQIIFCTDGLIRVVYSIDNGCPCFTKKEE